LNQTRLFLRAPKARAEAVYATLERVFEDDGYPLSLVEIDETGGIWEVSLYGSDPVRDGERMAAAISGTGSETVFLEEIPDIDWVAKSLEGLKPVRAGRFLVHGSHDRAARRPNDIAIEIEAGRAFGTGHHGTTAGCLAMLAEIMRRGKPRSALDLGTGSAVLAIAIARMARIPVLATDIDPVAVEVARGNVRLNRVSRLVHVAVAAGFRHRQLIGRRFDLIVANILARPLIGLAPRMRRHLAPGGSLVLSGILAGQRRQVIAAYAGQGFRHVQTRRRDDWVTLHLQR
jgi:ribosomal protein L11 methyltransferase